MIFGLQNGDTANGVREPNHKRRRVDFDIEGHGDLQVHSDYNNGILATTLSLTHPQKISRVW